MSVQVLLVDDDSDILDVIKYQLTSIGDISVETSQSARSALNMIENKSYDIVITDMSLSDKMIGGGSVIKKAQETGAFSVVFSGALFHGECKPDYVLPKPADSSDIEKMLSVFKTQRFKINVASRYRIVIK